MNRGNREDNGARREGVQRRAGVEDFLPVLPVRAAVDIDPQTASQGSHADSRHQVVERRGAHQRQALAWQKLIELRADGLHGAAQLNRLEEVEPVLGEGYELVHALPSRGRAAASPQSRSEVRRRRC